MTTMDECVLSSSKLLNLSVFSSRNVVISLIVGIWILSFIIAFVPIYTNIYTTREFTEGRDPCRCDFVVNEWSVRGRNYIIWCIWWDSLRRAKMIAYLVDADWVGARRTLHESSFKILKIWCRDSGTWNMDIGYYLNPIKICRDCRSGTMSPQPHHDPIKIIGHFINLFHKSTWILTIIVFPFLSYGLQLLLCL